MPGNVNEIDSDERIVEIDIERLREFRNHPFKVKADQQMLQLMDSIGKYGILNPLIVRPIPEMVIMMANIASVKAAKRSLFTRNASYISFPYCSSSTASHHSVLAFSPGISWAIC